MMKAAILIFGILALIAAAIVPATLSLFVRGTSLKDVTTWLRAYPKDLLRAYRHQARHTRRAVAYRATVSS